MSAFVSFQEAREVCRFGQQAACCRYLVAPMDARGFECAKHSEVAATINARVAAGLFTARGDNCDGKR